MCTVYLQWLKFYVILWIPKDISKEYPKISELNLLASLQNSIIEKSSLANEYTFLQILFQAQKFW